MSRDTGVINDYYSNISVDPIGAIKCLKFCIDTQTNAMLWGQPGVGKTSIIIALSQALGMPCHIFNPSQDDVIDMKLPYLEDGQVKFAYSSRLPRGDQPAIIFIDELNTAHMAMQATLYSLAHEQRIGDWKAPPGSLTFAAGNREHDKCAANPMSLALKDRFGLHINVIPSEASFVRYCLKNNLATEIVSFVKSNPYVLSGIDYDDPSGGCTPRSLEVLSKKIKVGIPRDIEPVVIMGTIGSKAGSDFNAHLKSVRAAVSIEEILKNPKTVNIPPEMDVIWSIAVNLSQIANKDNIENVAAFLDRLDEVYSTMAYTEIMRKNPSLQNCKEWRRYVYKNHEIMTEGSL